MRTILIIIILAAAALAAWFLLSNSSADEGNSDAEAAQAALDQIGLNNLKEQDLKNQTSFYQDEFDECLKACKKSKCCWLGCRKCKGQCRTDCLKQQQARYGLESLYTPSAGTGNNAGAGFFANLAGGNGTGAIVKPGKVREYNPLAG